MGNRHRLPLLLLMFMFTTLSVHGGQTPVEVAATSVLRVMYMVPETSLIPNSRYTLTPEERGELERNDWVLCVRIVPTEESGVVKRVRVPFFKYKNRVYVAFGFGSGYKISAANHWVTNDHVVTDRDDDTHELKTTDYEIALLRRFSPKPELIPARVLWSDWKKDLAIMQTDPAPDIHPLILADNDHITATMAVHSIGFPGAADQLSRGGGYEDEDAFLTPKINSGTISNSFVRQTGARLWQHQAGIARGNSGGPLVNECGQVVGTNVIGHVEWQFANGAIDNVELFPELDRLGVPYVTATGPCLPPTPVYVTLLYTATGVLFCLLLVIAAGLVHIRNQLRKGAPVPTLNSVVAQRILKPLLGVNREELTKAEGHTWKKDINGRWYRFDPVYGVLYREDTTSEERIALHSKQFKDLVLDPGQSVVIGSVADKAQVVIDSQFISSAHAQLTNQDGQLLVEDLGSTNGTFINGKRIDAPTYLTPGDTLRLTHRDGLADFSLDPEDSRGPGWVALVVPQYLGGKAVGLLPDKTLCIGRLPDNDIVLDQKQISGHHASLTARADGSITLLDLGSLNGTYVEGGSEPVREAVVRAGQTVYLADKIFSFKLVEAVDEP